MFPLHQIAHVGVSQSRGLKLFGREVILEEFQPMSSRYLNVTDRQTDGQTDRRKQSQYRAMHYVSRGKNAINHCIAIFEKYQFSLLRFRCCLTVSNLSTKLKSDRKRHQHCSN